MKMVVMIIWEMSLRGFCFESLITCVSLLRIWVLWKWLDLSGSDLKRLVLWTAGVLVGFWEMVEILETAGIQRK